MILHRKQIVHDLLLKIPAVSVESALKRNIHAALIADCHHAIKALRRRIGSRTRLICFATQLVVKIDPHRKSLPVGCKAAGDLYRVFHRLVDLADAVAEAPQPLVRSNRTEVVDCRV